MSTDKLYFHEKLPEVAQITSISLSGFLDIPHDEVRAMLKTLSDECPEISLTRCWLTVVSLPYEFLERFCKRFAKSSIVLFAHPSVNVFELWQTYTIGKQVLFDTSGAAEAASELEVVNIWQFDDEDSMEIIADYLTDVDLREYYLEDYPQRFITLLDRRNTGLLIDETITALKR